MPPLRVQVTLGDFRRKTADLPDDTALFIEYEDCSDFYEISALSMRYLPAALDAPPALTFGGGQMCDEEHYLISRLDVYLDCGDWNAGLKP